jgi:hypothetical protein
MGKLSFGGLSGLLAVVVIAGLTLFGVAEGQGLQQKKKVSYQWTSADAKYTKQYSIDVSPNHQIRILELHFTFPKNPPVFEGVKVMEEWMRGTSDYVDINGRFSVHGEYVMENGDKIYYWADGISQTITNPDGTRKSTGTGVKHLGGGTGKFSAIRGTLRYKKDFDPKTGFHEGQCEGEYWMEK